MAAHVIQNGRYLFGRNTVQNELDVKPSCPWLLCATVNTAIIYLFHGLLSVRYVVLYDRIERKWHVFVQKCKRFIGENINKHFPRKMPGRCPGTSFFKNNVPCATEGRSTLFIFLSKYSISLRRLLRYFISRRQWVKYHIWRHQWIKCYIWRSQ